MMASRKPTDGTPLQSKFNDLEEELRHVKSNPISFTHVGSRSALRAKRDTTDSDTATVISEKTMKRKQCVGPEKHAELEEDADPTPFRFRANALAMMLDPKNLEILEHMGGVDGLLDGLGVTSDTGLGMSGHSGGRLGAGVGVSHRHDPENGDETVPAITLTDPEGGKSTNWNSSGAFAMSLDDRRRIYGQNVLPRREAKSLLSLVYPALKDKVLVLLSIAAIVSLASGIFQNVGPSNPVRQLRVDWVEGAAIMVAIFVVVAVGSVNDWQKERQFQVLNDKKEERGVKVIRDGLETVIDINQVVVGDIALLEPGEIVPCDGVFLSGHNVRCDESGATGESDAIKKVSYDEYIQLRGTEGSAHTDCFVLSGSKVLEGVGKYVVVAVGTKSFNGRIMMALRKPTDDTPLQTKLNDLAKSIAKLGSAAGLILFTALLIRFFVQLGMGEPERTANQKGIVFVNILIISVTLIVVAAPEGLPLAVTLALAFATKRMTYEKLLVRILGSCETMANASVVCTDKTGILTQNVVTVVAGSVGINAKFVRYLEVNEKRSPANELGVRKHVNDFSLDLSQLNTVLSPQLRELFNAAIAVNSTAFQDKSPDTGELVFVGSKTETALLQFAHDLEWTDFRAIRDAAAVVHIIPFSSERKAMGVVVRNGSRYRLYLKGASEILSKKCVRHVVVHKEGPGSSSQTEEIETTAMDELANDNITRTTIFYANQMLRTIALCYRDLESWPPRDAVHDEQNEIPYEDLARDLTLIGIVGIEDPLRPGVLEAVKKCQMAGVAVKMCTGDNVLTARSIATQCGIFTPGGVIMEGPVFRGLTIKEKIEIVPRLQVLARSSPNDKEVLVNTLKHIGEIVGVTGDGTNDGPALKTVHVGFSMGIAGTEVAKEASDIILMDDNFASIVKAIIWGWWMNNPVLTFLQFQVSTNLPAVAITFVASSQESSVFSAVQFLWISIIMDTFAALALATHPASESLLNRKRHKTTAPMYTQILFQSTHKIITTLVFLGLDILGYGHSQDTTTAKYKDTIVQILFFVVFVFAYIFNSVNCGRLDRNLNIFAGILNNWYFITITLIGVSSSSMFCASTYPSPEIGVQSLIVFIGSSAFQVTRIGGSEWGIALALGFVYIPLGILVRLAQARNINASSSSPAVLGAPRAGPSLTAKISRNFSHKPSAPPVDKTAGAPPATKGTTAQHAAPVSGLHRGPWLEIHQNLVSYVSHTLELCDGSWDEIVQLSKQWAQWDDLTSLANYRFVVQILFGYLTKPPNSNRASALDIWDQISADIRCVLRHLNSILSDRTSYKLFLSCRGAVAQQLLDLLQDLLELHDLRFNTLFSKARFSKALLRLSCACGLHPTCFTLDGLEKTGQQVAGGGFGDIWKGFVGGQTVAIKIMRQFADDDVKASLKKLSREALIWRQLSHPNLLPFFGLYMLEHRPCLISPWMENRDLRLFLRTAPPGLDRVSLIADVAMGVEYLHSQCIVHGDLKTPNILVTPSGRACITDFGLSTIEDELSLKVTFSSRNGQAGTVRYQAPELLKNGPSHYGSDVYAFACVSYEILTSKVPFFESTNDAAVMFKVVEGARPSRLEVISQNLWLLLEDCWHQQTDKRPKMAAISQRLSRQRKGGKDIQQSPPRLG
ncbi:Calcium-transporting ATPase [Mycena sanguinolenta]|uniref:Calcium-transporting ATPase 2 n=1 Tax=Mycena sanguinolenta TaxID=230812 RepID=A0A8H6ZDE0_9AGAR|nr:Calcium-transporting ATPase [Mycena sanguinolenta]